MNAQITLVEDNDEDLLFKRRSEQYRRIWYIMFACFGVLAFAISLWAIFGYRTN